MNILLTLHEYIFCAVTNPYTIMGLNCLSGFIIIKELTTLIKAHCKSNTHTSILRSKALFFLSLTTLSIILENIAWIVHFIKPGSLLNSSISCLSWIFNIIKFHNLVLFFEEIVGKPILTKNIHRGFFILELMVCSFFIMNTISLINYKQEFHFAIIAYYLLIIAWLSMYFVISHSLQKYTLPKILTKQLEILFFYFLMPLFLTILLEFLPIILFEQNQQLLIFSNIGTILVTAGIYFCFKKIIQFRFLNITHQVQAPTHSIITENFKEIIEKINVATSPSEFLFITQQFCYQQLQINRTQKITFSLRATETTHQSALEKQIESFLNSTENDFDHIALLQKYKMLVKSEIDFDLFYTSHAHLEIFSNFLKTIDSDIFISIFNNKKLIGYIIIHNDGSEILYNQDIQNKLAVFTQFMAPALYLMLQQNVYTLLQESKTTKEQLFAKQQEVQQYKESIKQLLKDRIENHIGIVFFKNKQFIFKNKEALELLEFNLNLAPDHTLTTSLIHFSEQVIKFQSTQNMTTTLLNGKKLIITGMPHTGSTFGVLLIVRKAEATDTLRSLIDNLQNTTDRDYLLYLETTKIGQMINQMIPSYNDHFISVKINLLKAVLEKSALFLQGNEQILISLMPLFEELYNPLPIETLNLHLASNDAEKIIFGISSLLNPDQQLALLEKADNTILIIANIEHLSKQAQQKLVYFIRYGIYTPLKSEQRKFSSARIICTSQHDIHSLYQDNILIKELYHHLIEHNITIPSPVTMPQEQVLSLIDGFMYKAKEKDTENKLKALTLSEKKLIAGKHIENIFSLEQKIVQYMHVDCKYLQNTKNHSESNKPSQAMIHSNEIKLACQLGKHALKDIELMKSLCKQLGSQTKIAEILGVNRSTVNRRFKEYNLI